MLGKRWWVSPPVQRSKIRHRESKAGPRGSSGGRRIPKQRMFEADRVILVFWENHKTGRSNLGFQDC